MITVLGCLWMSLPDNCAIMVLVLSPWSVVRVSLSACNLLSQRSLTTDYGPLTTDYGLRTADFHHKLLKMFRCIVYSLLNPICFLSEISLPLPSKPPRLV